MTGHQPFNKGKKMSPELKEKVKHTFFKTGHKSQRKNYFGCNDRKCEMWKDDKFIRIFKSMSEAGRLTKISRRNINSVCQGQRNHAGGFIWKYAE